MKINKEQALGCALRLVKQYVDATARVEGDAVHYSHYRGEYRDGVPVRTTRRLTLSQCRQLTEDMSL